MDPSALGTVAVELEQIKKRRDDQESNFSARSLNSNVAKESSPVQDQGPKG